MNGDPPITYRKLKPGIRAIAVDVDVPADKNGENDPIRVIVANADQPRKSLLNAVKSVRELVCLPIFAIVGSLGRAARTSPGTVVAGTAAVAVAAAGVAFGIATLATRPAAPYGGPVPAATVTVTSGPGSDLTGPAARTLPPFAAPRTSPTARRGPSAVDGLPGATPSRAQPTRSPARDRPSHAPGPTATSGAGSVPSSQPHDAGPAQSDPPAPQPSQPAAAPGQSCALDVRADPLLKVCVG